MAGGSYHGRYPYLPRLLRQLRYRHHSVDHHHEGTVLSPHPQEHDLDEGDAGPSAADQRAALEAQERPSAVAARDDGAVPSEQGEPSRRLLADGRPDPDLLRLVRRPVRLGGDAERPIHLLRTAAVVGPAARGTRPLDLRPGRP